MGKLDASYMKYMSRKDYRVLAAVEKGMKDHEVVPELVVSAIASLQHGGCHKVLSELAKQRLVAYDKGARQYYGYRLTNLGHDFLALNELCGKDVIAEIGRQIGVGKESDIHVVRDPSEKELCIKLHRLGRTSFRQVKNKRDYHKHRSYIPWIHLSSVSAAKEFAFLMALHDHGFPVPRPHGSNRHAIVMDLIVGIPMYQVQEVDDPGALYSECMELIVRLAACGLIHGDFNEFNLMFIEESQSVVFFDLPQMVSTSHPNAKMYFDRDVECIRTFFRKKFGFNGASYPSFNDVKRSERIDVAVEASGFTRKDFRQIEEVFGTLAIEEGSDEAEEGGAVGGTDESAKAGLSEEVEDEDEEGGSEEDEEGVSEEDDDSEAEDEECAKDGGGGATDEGQRDSTHRENLSETSTKGSEEEESDNDSPTKDGSHPRGAKQDGASTAGSVISSRSRSAMDSKTIREIVKKEQKKREAKMRLHAAYASTVKPKKMKSARRNKSSDCKLQPNWDY